MMTREHEILATIDHYYCGVCGVVDPRKGEPCGGTEPTYDELRTELTTVIKVSQQYVDELAAVREINAKHVLNRIEIEGQYLDLRAEITRLSELLWGSRCVYCGEIVGKDKQNQDQADEVLRKHVWNCQK